MPGWGCNSVEKTLGFPSMFLLHGRELGTVERRRECEQVLCARIPDQRGNAGLSFLEPNARPLVIEELNPGSLKSGHDFSESLRSRAHWPVKPFHATHCSKSNF